MWLDNFFEIYDPNTLKPTGKCSYAATETTEVMQMDEDGGMAVNKDGSCKSPWKPSIHMPRWASRITLEVTEVRVQRLNEISEEDAKAEGVLINAGRLPELPGEGRCAFMHLWDSINGKSGFGWDVKPWVWAISFKRLEAK